MKRITAVLSCLMLLLSLAGTASAAVYEFNDLIEWWPGCLGSVSDVALITESNPLEYTHDLTDDVDFDAGDLVTEASLELSFVGDLLDGTKLWGYIQWDFREYVEIGYDGENWVYLDEVDNGQYEIELGIDWLNDDGFLDVTIEVSNPLGTATAWLDSSKLSGTATSTAPVPEPATFTFLLLGTGLIGLGKTFRKKLIK